MTHIGCREALLLRYPTGVWKLQEALATLVAANGVLLRFQTAQRFLATPLRCPTGFWRLQEALETSRSRRDQRSAFTIPESSAVPGGSNRRRTSLLDMSGDLMAAPRAQAMVDSRGNYADRGFRPSLEAQLSMVARRLSHRCVAIGLLPPSSESWRPTYSIRKFTGARWEERFLASVRLMAGFLHTRARAQ